MNQTSSESTLSSLVVKSDLTELTTVRDFCKAVVGALPLEDEVSEDLLSRVQLSVVESVTNIIRHSTDDETSKIEFEAVSRSNSLEFEILHEGDAFEPDSIPDIDAPLEGGMGLFLITQCATDVQYRTTDDGRQSVLLCYDTPPKEN